MEISVIIPIYNAEKYLKESITDLLNQTFKNFELILVNDGSTDNSLQIIKEFEKNDKRIKVLTKENSGAGDARNYGMEIASGKYLLFLDADDRFEPNILETSYEKAKETDAEIVIFAGDAFNYETNIRQDAVWLLRDKMFENDILSDGTVDPKRKNEIIYLLTNATVWNKLFKTSFVNRYSLKFQNMPRVDIMYFVMLALAYAEKIVILPKVLAHYRQGVPTGQIMNQDDNPLASYLALLAVKNKLEEDKIYYLMEKAFIGFALRSIRGRYNMFHSLYSERELFNVLHNEGFEKLGISGREELIEDKSLFAFYNRIKENKYEEYLLEMNEKYNLYGITKGEIYAVPQIQIPRGSKIVLYGAGNVGKSYFKQLLNTGEYKVVGWADRQYEAQGFPVESPEILKELDYDAVIVSLNSMQAAVSVKEALKEAGVDEGKIFWEKPVRLK